jgi:hypothetical protein
MTVWQAMLLFLPEIFWPSPPQQNTPLAICLYYGGTTVRMGSQLNNWLVGSLLADATFSKQNPCRFEIVP